MIGPNLRHRRREPEIMDQPDLDEQRHRLALRGLERLNCWSGSARLLWPAVARLASHLHPQPCRILDVATGAGDLPRALCRRAKRSGLRLELTACDVSPTALRYAEEASQREQAPIRFTHHDVIREGIPGHHDAILSSLFLHHLDAEDVIELLSRMKTAARHLVLINDLVRSRAGYWLAWMGSRLLTTSTVVRTDALLSVAAAFTPSEALDLARRAGLEGATLSRGWPCRFLLTWERGGPRT